MNGERFAIMAGVGFDAAMIREADADLKEQFGSLAYVVAGIRGVGRDAVQTRVEIEGAAWLEGPTARVHVGNMGDVLDGISAVPDARRDDGLLDVRVVTANGAMEWARTLGRTLIGDPGSSPFVETVVRPRST